MPVYEIEIADIFEALETAGGDLKSNDVSNTIIRYVNERVIAHVTEIAKELLNKNVPLKLISMATSLKVETLKEIKKQGNKFNPKTITMTKLDKLLSNLVNESKIEVAKKAIKEDLSLLTGLDIVTVKELQEQESKDNNESEVD